MYPVGSHVSILSLYPYSYDTWKRRELAHLVHSPTPAVLKPTKKAGQSGIRTWFGMGLVLWEPYVGNRVGLPCGHQLIRRD